MLLAAKKTHKEEKEDFLKKNYILILAHNFVSVLNFGPLGIRV